MKVLTFVIPAYNSEQFLDKCIPSMLVQEVLPKLEIIVVNDGSRDATPEIAQKYCDRYPDVVRLISQENKGHGGALNTGCGAAQGKYLKVIDADDWILSENLPSFISHLETTDSDVVLTHFHTVDVSTNEVKQWKTYPDAFGKAITLQDIMSDWRSFYRCLTFHGITYRTDFYQKHCIRLSEHVFYEDYEYATFPCCHAETVTPLDLFLYEYRIGDVSQSVSAASRLKRISHLETVLRRMIRESLLATDLPQGGNGYLVTKTQELLLSYFTTVLLLDPTRKSGRAEAREMMVYFRKEMPAVAAMAEKKFLIFCLLNRLHVRKETWDAFLASSLYNRIRKNHSFD